MTLLQPVTASHQPISKISSQSTVTSVSPIDYSVSQLGRGAIRNGVDFCRGMAKSRIFWAVAITSAALLVTFLVSNPVGWIASAIGVSILVAKIILCVAAPLTGMAIHYVLSPEKSKWRQQLRFEVTSTFRLLRDWAGLGNFDEITELDRNGNNHKLYLSALPNRLGFRGEELIRNGTVISINEPWERETLFLSHPYSEDDWKNLGVTYRQVNHEDNTVLKPETMKQVSQLIQEGLKKGSVLVHCRAGAARSASGVAAFLNDTGHSNPVGHVKKRRPIVQERKYVEPALQQHRKSSEESRRKSSTSSTDSVSVVSAPIMEGDNSTDTSSAMPKGI